MASFLNICLQVPNLGSLGFILVFIITIPYLLYQLEMLDLLQLYAPFVVMLASTLTQSGQPEVFKELYQIDPKTPSAFIMANMINLFALIGILWFSVGLALYHNNLELGVAIATISFVVTFPVAREAIPYLITEGDKDLKEKTRFRFPYNWHKYAIGFLVMGGLLILQYILVGMLIQSA